MKMTHRKTIKGHLESQASIRMANNERQKVIEDDKPKTLRSYGIRKTFYERFPEYKSQHWVDEVRRI